MNSREVLRKNGQAFSWATSFMPKAQAEDISNLYAFCRFVDDHVDLRNGSCDFIKEEIKNGASSIKEVTAAIELVKQKKIEISPLLILIETLDRDRKGIQIQNKKELIRYCYGVASTVGLMMCQIFKIKDERAFPFAIDLGIGMQLTNIARDIFEDALNDRVYLPQNYFKGGISSKHILNRSRKDEVIKAREEILKLSDKYYESADKGMHFLPLKIRFSILVASRLYQAKGSVIRSNPEKFYDKRADVDLIGKCAQTMRALSSLPPLSFPSCEHDPSLHRDLIFLPYTHS